MRFVILAEQFSDPVGNPLDEGLSLDGIAHELGERGHDVELMARPVSEPALSGLQQRLDSADVVIVDDSADAAVVGVVAQHHWRHPDYLLIFHDAHDDRAAAVAALARLDLRGFDAVLALRSSLAALLRDRGAHRRVFSWRGAVGDADRVNELELIIGHLAEERARRSSEWSMA